MKIFQIYNEHRDRFGGEVVVVDTTMRLLEKMGHEPRLLTKSSRVLEKSLIKRVNAFWGGVYNVGVYKEMRALLKEDRPDVVHVHSVYPMFSPSVLVAFRRAGIPIVMTVHSNNLTCPTWNHLYKGRVCEDCVGGHEYRCVLKNCRNNILESAAYALRSSVARRFRLFHDNLSLLIVQTRFSKEKLMHAGFRQDQIAVVPNPSSVKEITANHQDGKYVAFAGRISPEKGVDLLLDAASRMPDVPFKVAGDGPILAEMVARAPRNVEFVGRLDFENLVPFYRKARMLVVPSLCFELFGMVVVDAMALGIPVIASRIGGLPHVVDEGVTGALFEPGDAGDLANRIRFLWSKPELGKQMGQAGQQKVLRQYTEGAYFHNLMAVYQKAIQLSRNRSAATPLVRISAMASTSSETDGR